MGRITNADDLSAGMGGNKLLTDKAHRDGSPSRRNRTDVKNYVDPRAVHAENKQITSELRKRSSTKKSGGMSMKTLIAQEMSKEIESKRKQPNVVARLMGLDEALPTHQSVLNGQRCIGKSGRSSCVTSAGALQRSLQQDVSYLKVHPCSHEKEYRDVCESWQQPPKTSHLRDHPLQNGRHAEIQDEMRMALVRQKFMEAKRLATDQRLLQSKEFQDAVEVLSSNRDLFIKFLEEPNSLFSSHLKERHSTPVEPQTKRITVLKPLKTLEAKQQYPVNQPTRIVVLKPRSRKHIDAETIIKNRDFDQLSEVTESVGCRDIVKDVSRQMIDNVNGNRRDESLLSGVLSNGYVGDESSFNRSEIEECSKLSDYEIPSPISRHSWDYSNRFGSPYSLSSFSRASNSPEPSVIREAKKRLSERWSMMASNVNNQEQMEVQRISSTLGEMLAISELKKEETRVRRSCDGDEDLRVSRASTSTCQTRDGDGGDKFPSNLSRSRSLPVSSANKNVGLNSEVKKPVVVKDASKSKSGRSSFKGKVSSLFFSRSKKVGRDKSHSSPGVSSDDNLLSSRTEAVVKENDDLVNQVCNGQHEDCLPAESEDDFIKASSTALAKGGLKQGSMSFKDVLSLGKPSTSDSISDASSSNKFCENQSQPSPTSVLDAPFEDDTSNNTCNFSEVSDAKPSVAVASIESIARTLSWDDSNMEISLLDASERTRTSPKANVDEQQTFFFVQNILSSAHLDNEKLSMVFTRWHSIDSPLDPSLLNKLLDRKEEDAKSREKRSNQRFIFDCINFALSEIGRSVYLTAYPWARVCGMARKKSSTSAFIGDEVWLVVSDWLSSEKWSELNENDNSGLLVDRLLRNEVGGIGWHDLMRSEIDEMSKEIGGAVLEKLIEEALADLTLECLL